MACACDQSTHGYVVAYWWVQEEVTDRFVLICHTCYLGSSVYFVILYSLETWLLVGVGWRWLEKYFGEFFGSWNFMARLKTGLAPPSQPWHP